MKKILSLFVIVLMVAFVASVANAQAYGDSRIGNIKLLSKTITSDTAGLANYSHCHITTSPTAVYRVTFTPTAAGACLNLYDSNQMGTGTINEYVSGLAQPKAGGSAFVKADIAEATANATTVVEYDIPLQFENGLFAGFGKDSAGTIATIEYRQN